MTGLAVLILDSTVRRWYSEVRSRPLELLLGACIFFVAATGGAVQDVASTALAVMFIVCLVYIRQWPQSWRALSRNERLMLTGLALFAISGFLAYYNAEDKQEYVKHMGRYIRFLLIVPVYLLLTRTDLKLFRYLLSGAVVSGPIYLVFTLISASQRPDMPASWQYHHILFGDAAMLNAIFMTAVLVTARTRTWMKAVLIASILCTLYASIMSQARGAWIALPACLLVLSFIAVRSSRINKKSLFFSLAILLAVITLSPVKHVIETRYDEAVHEIERFSSGEQFATSVGGRLAMWHVALKVWQQYPFVGTGPGDFDLELRAAQESGIYPSIDVHSSTHNIYLQSLVTTGLIGFLALCAGLVLLPLRLFMQAGHREFYAARVGGILVIAAFAVFGLTESWILRAPMISLYLVYLITLSATVSGKPVTAE